MTAPEPPAVVLRRAAERARRHSTTVRTTAARTRALNLATRFDLEAARIERGDESNVTNATAAARTFLRGSV
ncbi:MAG TPA: hypothetical protein VL551_22505 [Actinospica sp.]|jgi:hypothetical protein|nr:hypothetical protein [Actinospica sp.]